MTKTYTMADGTTRTLESREHLPRLTGEMYAIQVATDLRLDAIGIAAAKLPADQFVALMAVLGRHLQAAWWTWGDIRGRAERSAQAILTELDDYEIEPAEMQSAEQLLAR